MAIFNKVLDDCVIIYKDAYGKNRLISGNADALFYDWWHECNYVGAMMLQSFMLLAMASKLNAVSLKNTWQ